MIRSCLAALFGCVVFAWKASAGFMTAPTYPAGIGPWTVAVADFNGDGIPDLAVANYGDNRNGAGVSILLGNGDGTFERRNYALGTYAGSVAVADFNGDGVLDLAVADRFGLSLLLGNGDGTFQAAQNYAAGSGGSLVVADFNGDGLPDLALSNSATILLNQP